MKAIILSIGDELALGQTIDTNSAWLSQQLAAVGCDIAQHVTIPDDRAATAEAIKRASMECEVLLVTGGLGPTADDLTRQALADALEVKLEANPIALAQLEAFFKKRNRPMSDSNRVQALVPRGAEVLENSVGTAPGIHASFKYYTVGRGGALVSLQSPQVCAVYVMPGVPKEMREMFLKTVAPRLKLHSGRSVILSRILHTFGLPESIVGERLSALMDRKRNPSVGTTVSRGLISLRINARCASREIALAELDNTEALCREALGAIIFGKDEQTLPAVVGEMLAANSQTIATAESCTGGLLTKMLTDVPGSSRYVGRGWITYSNQAKTETLGVPVELLAQHGAVSEPVALSMADGARQRSGADFALSITGIAGPDGGTPEKPVGTVCIALAHTGGVTARTFVLPGDREMVRERSANMALTMLRFHLLRIRLPI